MDAAREADRGGEEQPLPGRALAQLHAARGRAVARQGHLGQLGLVLDEDRRRVGAGLLQRGEGRVAGLGVPDRELLGLREGIGVELAGAGVPDDPVGADRRDLSRLRREAELRGDRRGEHVALGAQHGDRAQLGGHGIHRAVDPDGDRGVAADLGERLGLGLEAVEAGDPRAVVDVLRAHLALRRVDHGDGLAAHVDEGAGEDAVAGGRARLRHDDRLLGSEGALGRVDRDDLVARFGVADDRCAVLEDVEARTGRAVRQHARVELTGRLVDAPEAGLLGVGHPDAAVVEVGLADDLTLAAGGHPDEQAREEGDDDGGDDPDPSLGGGGAHAFPCSATTIRSSTLFSSSGVVSLVTAPSRRARSPSVTSLVERACSTSRALRLVASLPTPPCRPRVPASASFWQTLSSLRLNRVRVQPSRSAAAAEEGIWFVPASRRRRNGSQSATTSSFWSGVNDTRPTVAAPTSSSVSAEPSAGASAVTDRKAGLATWISKS